MAIKSLDKAIEIFGTPLYVYHEIVHNRYVVDRFRKLGAVFVDFLEQVPPDSTLLFSAHGVSPEIRRLSKERRLRTIDATCPLVTKVHLEAIKFAKEGYTIVLVGHEGHDEVIGTMGEAPDRIRLVESEEDVENLSIADTTKIAYLTQTTLSLDDAARIIGALKRRFPQIVGPKKDDICYATQNRQEAVREIVPEADLVIVLGSQNSSNSQRLRELAEARGTPSYLVDGASELRPEWFAGVETVLVTAGASAPEEVVNECLTYLEREFGATIEERVIREEDENFPLPRELRVIDRDRLLASKPSDS
jgi:4-hydroxy-3-methylbut-2-enyl diphosphate reductase